MLLSVYIDTIIGSYGGAHLASIISIQLDVCIDTITVSSEAFMQKVH